MCFSNKKKHYSTSEFFNEKQFYSMFLNKKKSVIFYIQDFVCLIKTKVLFLRLSIEKHISALFFISVFEKKEVLHKDCSQFW